MLNNWIKLNRGILEWEWYQDISTKTLFIHFLLSANYEPKKWQGIEVKRGSLIAGRKALSGATGLSEQQIRTSIEKLCKTGDISTSTTNRFTVVTVTNYEEYQKKEEQQPTDNQQSTNNQPTDNQQITTTKETKKERNKESIYILLPAYIDSNLWEDFLLVREKKKAPNSKTALNRIVAKLDRAKIKGFNPNEMLENSIIGNWTGVHEPKGYGYDKRTNGSKDDDSLNRQLEAIANTDV